MPSLVPQYADTEGHPAGFTYRGSIHVSGEGSLGGAHGVFSEVAGVFSANAAQ